MSDLVYPGGGRDRNILQTKADKEKQRGGRAARELGERKPVTEVSLDGFSLDGLKCWR